MSILTTAHGKVRGDPILKPEPHGCIYRLVYLTLGAKCNVAGGKGGFPATWYNYLPLGKLYSLKGMSGGGVTVS